MADLSPITVITAWPTQWLRMEERPPMWRVAANILNKQWRPTYKGWSSRLGVWGHHRMVHSLVADGGNAPVWRITANILNKLSRTAEKGWSSSLGVWGHHRMAHSLVADGGNPPVWRITANILNKQARTADKGWSSSLRFGRGADNSSP